jgi:catalase
VAILIDNGVDAASITAVKGALTAAGAIPLLVAKRLGTFAAAGGEALEADATMENSGPVVFDALVLPDGQAGVAALAKVGNTMEFVVNQYRHCKTILALGASTALLDKAGIAAALPSGEADPGLLIAAAGDAANAAAAFVAAIGRHRHPERDLDPPLI